MTTDRPGDAALQALLVAAALLSVTMTTYVGWHSNARVLIGPFVVWVLAPFIVISWALPRTASPAARKALAWASVVVAVGSVAAYAARVVRPPGSQGAFVFVIVPPLAVLLVGTVLLVARARRPH